MNTEQIKDILAAHSAWVRGEGGTRANLIGANLYNADLSGANLREAEGLERASVSWHSHGTLGRELLCVRVDKILIYFCGCFRGTGDDLQAFIDANAVDERTTQSRRKAFWIVSDLITDSSGRWSHDHAVHP